MVGDNGFALFDATGVLVEIRTTIPTVGGVDEIVVGDGSDVVLGGAATDYINIRRATGEQVGEDRGDDVFVGS